MPGEATHPAARQADVSFTIVMLREHLEIVRRQEVAKALSRLQNGRLEPRELVEALSDAITDRIFYDSTIMIRELCRNGRAQEFGRMVHELFEDADVIKGPDPTAG